MPTTTTCPTRKGEAPAMDADAKKTALRMIPYGLYVLSKGQQGQAFAFFKPAQVKGDKISGEPFRKGATGAPILTNMPAAVECKVVEIVERGDHHTVIGEVVEA